jgi:hypothetical protein
LWGWWQGGKAQQKKPQDHNLAEPEPKQTNVTMKIMKGHEGFLKHFFMNFMFFMVKSFLSKAQETN